MMTLDRQDELRSAYSNFVSGPEGQRAWEMVLRDIKKLVPDGDDLVVGVALVEGVPTVLVVTGAVLFRVHYVADRDAATFIRTPIVPSGSLIRMENDDKATTELEDFLGKAETVQARVRHWTFSWDGCGDAIAVTGIVEVAGGRRKLFPDSAEQVARALADRLGWLEPAADER